MAGGAGAVAPGSFALLKKGLFPRHYLVAFCLVTSLFFLWGFAYGLLDVLNKHFQNVLGITKTMSTLLQVAYFGWGYFVWGPFAGEVLRRWGYKVTIIMGLCFYSTGAIFFWPVAKLAHSATPAFAGFVVCTGCIAMGLASLEIAANSYISVMPPITLASLRLNFSQSFNGVASFAGPLIASKYFFEGENANNLDNVQWVYLAVAAMGVLVAVGFLFTKLPDVSEDALEEALLLADPDYATRPAKSVWREPRAITGFFAQFFYVGAQVTIGAFFLFYTHESAGIADTRGSQLLSYALILFTVGRFVGTALLSVVAPAVLLFIYAIVCCLLTILIVTIHGMGGVTCLMVIMFFESIMYPTIFVLATSNLGRNTRRAAALLVQGVVGGAVFPPIQGAISDAASTRTSYWIVLPCFVYIALWSVWLWNKDGRAFTVAKAAAHDPTALGHNDLENGGSYPAELDGGKGGSVERIEGVEYKK